MRITLLVNCVVPEQYQEDLTIVVNAVREAINIMCPDIEEVEVELD